LAIFNGLSEGREACNPYCIAKAKQKSDKTLTQKTLDEWVKK
jgi:hypothetical protein